MCIPDVGPIPCGQTHFLSLSDIFFSLVRRVSALLCARYCVQHGGEVHKEMVRHVLCLNESQSLRGGTDD